VFRARRKSRLTTQLLQNGTRSRSQSGRGQTGERGHEFRSKDKTAGGQGLHSGLGSSGKRSDQEGGSVGSADESGEIFEVALVMQFS